MNNLKNAIVQQLTTEDAAIYKNNDKYIHIYGREDADWGIDIYDGMDYNVPSFSCIMEKGTAAEAFDYAGESSNG